MQTIRCLIAMPFWMFQGFFGAMRDASAWMAHECEKRGDMISGLKEDN